MTVSMSSRQFNQDVSRAKRAASGGPVFITDRGQPSHVLLTIEEYRRLTGPSPSLAVLLRMSDGDDIEFDPPRMTDLPRVVDFD